MRIGELATRSGVSTRSLRYYEEQGLLSADRTYSQQRVYPESAVETVQFIQQLYSAGLSSRNVREILPCSTTGRASPEMLLMLVRERDRISASIGELETARGQLDYIIGRAREYAHSA